MKNKIENWFQISKPSELNDANKERYEEYKLDITWWVWGGSDNCLRFGSLRSVSLRWRRRVEGLFILGSGANWWGWICQSLAQSVLVESVVEVGKLRNSWTWFLFLFLLFSFCWDGNSSLHVGGGVEGPPLFPTTTPPFNFSTINPSTLFSPFSLLSIFLLLLLLSTLPPPPSNFKF